jgi:hypothetical protein
MAGDPLISYVSFLHNAISIAPQINLPVAGPGFARSGGSSDSWISYSANPGYGKYFLNAGNESGQTPDGISWIVPSGDVTVEGWFNVSGAQPPGIPVGFGANSTTVQFRIINSLSQVTFVYGAAGIPAIVGLPTGVLRHVAMSFYSNSTMQIFLDGVLQSTTSSLVEPAWGGPTFNIRIGVSSGAADDLAYFGFVGPCRITNYRRYTGSFSPLEFGPFPLTGEDGANGAGSSKDGRWRNRQIYVAKYQDEYYEFHDSEEFEEFVQNKMAEEIAAGDVPTTGQKQHDNALKR